MFELVTLFMGDVKSKLYDAVERENLPDIQKILVHKPELLDEPFDPKSTMNPFLRSVWRGNFHIVVWLLDNGADINKRGNIPSPSQRRQQRADLGCNPLQTADSGRTAQKRS